MQYYRIFHWNTGKIIKRFRSLEAAEAYRNKENRLLKKNPAMQDSYLPWSIANPGESIGVNRSPQNGSGTFVVVIDD